MSRRDHYPVGVPCWIETLQPDAKAARDFYGALFGWTFEDSDPMSEGPGDRDFVARIAGSSVAGIGSLPDGSEPRPVPEWITYIRVESADEAAHKVAESGGTIDDGPRDALPAGRLALLVDPAGARFGVWEAGAREGAQLINEPQAWALSSLRTTDPEGSKTFYSSLFGWQPETLEVEGGHVTLWRLPGYVGGEPDQGAPRDTVGIMSSMGGQSSAGAEHSHWSVDFYCDDADATADQAARLGGRVIVAPFENPGFRRAVLADPQGATFTVTQQTSGQSG
jgi:predicted enzyme related to lactoylglutathione lyase